MKYLEIQYKNGDRDLVNLETVSFVAMHKAPDGKRQLEILYPEMVAPVTGPQGSIRHGGAVPFRQYACVGVNVAEKLADDCYKAICDLLKGGDGFASVLETDPVPSEFPPPLKPVAMLDEEREKKPPVPPPPLIRR